MTKKTWSTGYLVGNTFFVRDKCRVFPNPPYIDFDLNWSFMSVPHDVENSVLIVLSILEFSYGIQAFPAYEQGHPIKVLVAEYGVAWCLDQDILKSNHSTI